MRENFWGGLKISCNSVNLNPFELTLQLAGLFDYTVNYELEISFFFSSSNQTHAFKNCRLMKIHSSISFFFFGIHKKIKYNSWIFNEKNGPAKCRVCPFPRHAQDITTR